MITTVLGNVISYTIESNDKTGSIPVTLPDGYSIAEMFINADSEISLSYGNITFPINTLIKIPVVNSKSPNHFFIYINTLTPTKKLTLYIYKFGGIPDPNYFNSAFEPILVTTKDNNNQDTEYNMISSTQYTR